MFFSEFKRTIHLYIFAKKDNNKIIEGSNFSTMFLSNSFKNFHVDKTHSESSYCYDINFIYKFQFSSIHSLSKLDIIKVFTNLIRKKED